MDVISGGSDRPRWSPPRWSPPRWAKLAGAVALATGLGIALALHGPSGQENPGAPLESPASEAKRFIGPILEVPPRDISGLVIDHAIPPGGMREIRDPGANAGPWTVVVRHRSGSLGKRGAVVTFPVAAPAKKSRARRVRAGNVSGIAGDRMIRWPLAGAYARVRGDLPQRELLRIAANTSVTAGRPNVHPPESLVVTSRGPYRSPEIRTARYMSADVAGAGDLNGPIEAGVVRVGGYEDQLHASTATRPAGRVHGWPAVTSVVQGSADFAWEPAPGVVAYISCSGSLTGGDLFDLLRRLANRAQVIGLAQWNAARPAIVTKPPRS